MANFGVRVLLLSTAAVLPLGSAAQAQETQPQSSEQESVLAAQSADESLEGEIVVTARKREERLLDVPVSVTAISGATLERQDASDLASIGQLVPTVIVANYKINGGGSIAIRGISTPGNQVGFEQAVSVAVDGVQSSNGQIAQLVFFDLQQVEVLKGPQALFFGKNNTAGVISLITAGPTPTFEAKVRTGYEFVADEAIVEGAVSGPLTENTGFRLAVRYRHMEGWLRNLARPTPNPFYNAATGAPASVATLPGALDTRPGETELLGRLTLKADLTPNLTATLKVSTNHAEDSGAGVNTQNIGPCSDGRPRVAGVPDPFGECEPDDRISLGDVAPHIASTVRGDVNSDGSAGGRMKLWHGVLAVNWQQGPFLIDSLTGYSSMRYKYFSGADQTTFSQLTVYENQTQEDVSQELRLRSDWESPLNFLVGAFYQDSKRRVINDNKLFDSHYSLTANRYTGFHTDTRQPGETISAFGQLIWDIMPTLELAGGARWTREKKRFEKFGLYGFGSFNVTTTVFPGEPDPGVLRGTFKDTNLSPEATLSWRPNPDQTFYVAYRTGYKSGGFGMTNPLQKTTRLGDVDFDSETVDGFELGAKGRFFSRALTLNAGAFAYDFKDLQVNVYDPARIAFTINNAGKLKQRGLELEADYKASQFLTLHGAAAYVKNTFQDFIGQCYAYTFPAGTVRATAVPPPKCSFVNQTALTLQQVFDGRTPARSPRLSGNAGFVADVPVGRFLLGFTGDAYYTSKYYAADTLAPPSFQPSYWTFNTGVSLSPADNRWRLSLTGRNLTNEYVVLYAVDRTHGTGVPGAIGEQRGVVSRGREVLLQAQMRF